MSAIVCDKENCVKAFKQLDLAKNIIQKQKQSISDAEQLSKDLTMELNDANNAYFDLKDKMNEERDSFKSSNAKLQEQYRKAVESRDQMKYALDSSIAKAEKLEENESSLRREIAEGKAELLNLRSKLEAQIQATETLSKAIADLQCQLNPTTHLG